jgi:hypothetical protein
MQGEAADRWEEGDEVKTALQGRGSPLRPSIGSDRQSCELLETYAADLYS